jgi:hypothetical protein
MPPTIAADTPKNSILPAADAVRRSAGIRPKLFILNGSAPDPLRRRLLFVVVERPADRAAAMMVR